MSHANRIDSTARIHPDAKVSTDVEIGPWCVVGPNVELGSGTRLISHVVVDGHTRVGKQNTIHPFSVLGGPPQDLKHRGELTRLELGDRNIIREGVTLNLGTVGGGGVTRIGNDCLIMAYSHIGHDSVVGNGCVIANAAAIAGHVTIEDYAWLGGQVGVVQFLRIGKHSYVAGQSGIEKEVPPFSVVIGQRPPIVKGANIVGLRRRGFKNESIQALAEAFRIWGNAELKRDEALTQLQPLADEVAEVKELLEFIKSSEAGVIR